MREQRAELQELRQRQAPIVFVQAGAPGTPNRAAAEPRFDDYLSLSKRYAQSRGAMRYPISGLEGVPGVGQSPAYHEEVPMGFHHQQ